MPVENLVPPKFTHDSFFGHRITKYIELYPTADERSPLYPTASPPKEAFDQIKSTFGNVPLLPENYHELHFIKMQQQINNTSKTYGTTELAEDNKRANIEISARVSTNFPRAERVSIFIITMLHEMFLHGIPDLIEASKTPSEAVVETASEFEQHENIFSGVTADQNPYHLAFAKIRDSYRNRAEIVEQELERLIPASPATHGAVLGLQAKLTYLQQMDMYLTRHYIRDLGTHVEELATYYGNDHRITEAAAEMLDDICEENEIDPTYTPCLSENARTLVHSSRQSHTSSVRPTPSPFVSHALPAIREDSPGLLYHLPLSVDERAASALGFHDYLPSAPLVHMNPAGQYLRTVHSNLLALQLYREHLQSGQYKDWPRHRILNQIRGAEHIAQEATKLNIRLMEITEAQLKNSTDSFGKFGELLLSHFDLPKWQSKHTRFADFVVDKTSRTAHHNRLIVDGTEAIESTRTSPVLAPAQLQMRPKRPRNEAASTNRIEWVRMIGTRAVQIKKIHDEGTERPRYQSTFFPPQPELVREIRGKRVKISKQ
jgi:hypothetical protein